MHGKGLLGKICFLSMLLLLGACQDNEKPQVSDKPVVSSISKEFQLEKPDFLKKSKKIQYPKDSNFVPTALNNNYLLVGESSSHEAPTEKYLSIFNLSTQEFTQLKKLEQSSDVVSLIVNFVDEDYILFEEFDQVNQKSKYYIWELASGACYDILNIEAIDPIHYTQVVRQNDMLIINAFYKDSMYRTYQYGLKNKNLEILEDENSSSPVIFKDALYYIRIQNQQLKTEIIRYDGATKEKTLVQETGKADEFYTGLLASQNQLITLKNENQLTSVLYGDFKDTKILFQSDWVETAQMKQSFLSFLGNRRDEERIRPQYYLLDVEHKIDYLYSDGPILLADNGIFWIEYLKDEKDIEKGTVYTNDNSIMRFYEFPKR